jgi:ABC-type maltose transport system permease subunit
LLCAPGSARRAGLEPATRCLEGAAQVSGVALHLGQTCNLDYTEGSHQYLDWLRSVISERSQNIRRLATLILVLMAIFELVSNAKGESITIASFRVVQHSVVLQFIPGLVSYLYFQVYVDTVQITSLYRVFTFTFRRWRPDAERNDLDSLIIPSLPLFWNPVAGRIRPENSRPKDKLEEWASTIFVTVILVGVLAFEAQAYYALFRSNFPRSDILWLVSLSFTVFCLAMTVTDLYLVVIKKED